MKLSFIFFVIAVFLPGSDLLWGARSSSSSHYNSLKKQEKQCIQDIKTSQKRQSEIKFVSGHMHNFRDCLLSRDLTKVRRNGNGIVKKLKDKSLKSLLKNFFLSMNGLETVTALERDAYIALCRGLETALGAPRAAMAKLKRVRIELIPYIPPKVIRQMNRHARTLAREATGAEKIRKKIVILETQCEQEKASCAGSPLRDRKALRQLTGQLALNRKKLELIKAARVFATCLTDSIFDGKLLTEEKLQLTKAQSNFTRLQAAIGILKSS